MSVANLMTGVGGHQGLPSRPSPCLAPSLAGLCAVGMVSLLHEAGLPLPADPSARQRGERSAEVRAQVPAAPAYDGTPLWPTGVAGPGPKGPQDRCPAALLPSS